VAITWSRHTACKAWCVALVSLAIGAGRRRTSGCYLALFRVVARRARTGALPRCLTYCWIVACPTCFARLSTAAALPGTPK
jgi:hypothetical protein